MDYYLPLFILKIHDEIANKNPAGGAHHGADFLSSVRRTYYSGDKTSKFIIPAEAGIH
jgi:hypothetical protein